MIYKIEEVNTITLDEANNPIFISENDIYINFDKFKSGKSKVIQITGLSGSGKSTLAKEIAKKYNAYLIETDTICFAIAKSDENATWEYIKKKDKYLYQYMKEKNLPPNFMRKYDFKTVTLKEADKRDHEGVKFLKWLYFEADIKEPIVVEGGCVAFAISVDDSFLQIPTIFKGTSIITSLFRRFNRSSNRQGILSAAKNAAKFYVKQYSKMIPEVNKAREKFYTKKDEMLFTNEVTYPDTKEYDLSKTKFIHCKREFGYSDEPYLEVDGKRYRVRAELLLFNDEGKLFVNPHTSKPRGGMIYSLPGGGIQPNESIEQAAARETEEEALLVPKNVEYSGYHYKIMWDKPNDNIMRYDGMLAFICTGDYDKKYTKYVRKQDRSSLAEKGVWMYPENIDTLSPVHKKVIEQYRKNYSKLHEYAIMDTIFLDTEYVLIESAGYKEAKVVYDSLSEKDKQLCSPRGKYVDSSNIAYRYVHKINNHPVGFIDCYKYNHSNHSAFIILAVNPAYRGNGIGKLMLKKAEYNCKLLGFQKLIYRVEKENIPSFNLAKKNGYTLTLQTKNQYTFIKEL